ncbi:MAG TPA: protein phosphatase 2C domain-containing protein [Opitutales bacterium]|nr:protein phosphatase 2C domain-containing protein [Opitutales bacterium]
MIKSYADTHPGMRRNGNEDSFLLQPERGIYAVADGLGGLSYGEVASGMAAEMLGSADMQAYEDLTGLVRGISVAIAKKGHELNSGTIGTTLTLAILDGGYARLAQVGDSLAYMVLPDGQGIQLTREQTVAEEYRRAGRTDFDPYMEHVLTQCLGQDREVMPDVFVREFPVGARMLLCSDGITKTIEDARIYEIVRTGSDPKSIVDTLISTANANGGPDNSTALVIFNEPDEAPIADEAFAHAELPAEAESAAVPA